MVKPRPPPPGGTGRKVKQFALWCGAICLVAAAVNTNVSRLQVRSADVMSKASQKAIASTGRVLTASGSTISTAVAKQGAAQCSSSHASDTPTAQCQAFCNDQFKKFHCLWCKCRACTFCPKGSDAIEQAAADDSPPPPSPPPLSGQGGSGVSPSLLLGAVAADVSGSTSSTEAGPAVQGLAAGGDVAAAGAAAEPGANEEAAANAALDALPARPTSAASPLAASSPRTGPDGEAANQKLGEVAPSAASAGEQVAQLSSGDAPSRGLGDAAAEAGISAGATGTVGAGGGAADVPGAAGSSAAGMVAGGAHGVAGASEPSEREEPGLTGGEADVGADADALMDAVDGASYAGEGEEEEGGVGLGGADVSGEAAPQREAAQGEGGPDVPPAGGAANGADASSAGAAGGGGAAAVGDVAPDQGLTAGMSGESEAAEEAMEAGGAMAVD